MLTLELRGLDEIFAALTGRGYLLVGPTIRNKAIIIDRIASVNDLPKGWTDRQDPGSYTLERRKDSALFGFAVGPFSWKSFLRPPRTRLNRLQRNGKGFESADVPAPAEPKPMAFIGVRSCDLQALAREDRIFLDGPYPDPHYRHVRSTAFILAVDCAHPGGTCFCTSSGSGPRVLDGYDIALTELCEEQRHVFLARAGSPRGEEILTSLQGEQSTQADLADGEAQSVASALAITRHVDIQRTKETLAELFDHPSWDEIAKRCLTCANCTMVCPTCFCSTIDESTDLAGVTAERWNRWDSCFTLDFARVAGGNFRPSTKARIRQRIMHKFSYWVDQFGVTGCVGCGRCITWCPAAIDITSYLDSLCKG